MQFYSRLTTLRDDYPRLVIALGMFDGVHRGHRSIISRAVELAHEIGGTSMVFTFSNHPLAVLAPQAVPPQISNNALRRQLIEALGAQAPRYMHLPLVLNPEGQKLSKQQGATPLDEDDPLGELERAWMHLGFDRLGADSIHAFWDAALPLWKSRHAVP